MHETLTMYKNNSRDRCKLRGCSPLQLLCNLTKKCHAVGYYSYTHRWQSVKNIMKNTIAILLIFCSINASAQFDDTIKNDDHLKPVSGILDSYDFMVDYHLKIRKILLNDLSDGPYLRYLVIPSFEPSYVFDIEKEFEPEKYYIHYHKCKKQIWYNKDWKKVKVKKHKSELEKQSAYLIFELYKVAINNTKYSENEIIGFDGTDYYFSVFEDGTKSGTAWSPFEKTRTGKLVDISNEIIKLVEKGKKNIEFNNELKNKINKLIIEYE